MITVDNEGWCMIGPDGTLETAAPIRKDPTVKAAMVSEVKHDTGTSDEHGFVPRQ